MMRDSIHERCRGRWPSILTQLGFPHTALAGRNVACPMCGGTDRFRFTDRDGQGVWICNQCGGKNHTGGAASGVDLVMAFKGVNFRGACELIEGVVGKAALNRPQRERPGEDQAREAMKWLWGNSQPLDGTDPASIYLMSRSIISLPPPNAVRYCDQMPDYVPALKRKVYRPAMISKVVNGERAALHITYLTITGEKADVPKVKRFFTGARVPAGGAVRLAPAAELMGVATGVETTLSAMQKHGFPCWATLSDVGLLKFEPPPECRSLIVFADADESFAGQLAAVSLAHVLARRVGFKVRFCLPPGELKDWNDVVRAERDASNIVRIHGEDNGAGEGDSAPAGDYGAVDQRPEAAS
jgi:putative DNA primase/helicase